VSARDFDVLLISGGSQGVANLRADARVIALVRAFAAADSGSAPSAPDRWCLQDAGILKGRHATCHPGVEDELTDPSGSPDRSWWTSHRHQPGSRYDAGLHTHADPLVSGEAIRPRCRKGMVLDPSLLG